jgi:hypothetical protein
MEEKYFQTLKIRVRRTFYCVAYSFIYQGFRVGDQYRILDYTDKVESKLK